MKTLSEYKINISINVINYLEKIIKDNKIPSNYRFRISAVGAKGGIFDYGVGFDSTIQEKDSVFQFENVEFIIDLDSLLNLEGTSIDYVLEENRQGFVFDNPNQLHSCSGHCNCSCNH